MKSVNSICVISLVLAWGLAARDQHVNDVISVSHLDDVPNTPAATCVYLRANGVHCTKVRRHNPAE